MEDPGPRPRKRFLLVESEEEENVERHHLGPDGLLVVSRNEQVESVDPDPGSVVGVAEQAKEEGVKGLPPSIFLFPKHRLQRRRLFERLPGLGDINQRQLADCWFLAPLAAIISLGSGYAIESMMCGIGDYAYVRLWDRAQIPHIVRLDKGLIEVWGSAVFHSVFDSDGGLWAAVLEKAMTAIDGQGRFDPRGAAYGRLPYQETRIALQALLGVEAKTDPIGGNVYHYEPFGDDFNTLRHILLGTLDSGSLKLQFVFRGLGPVNELSLFYDTHWVPWVQQTGVFSEWWQTFIDVPDGGVYRQEDFESFMERFAGDASRRLQWMSRSQWNLGRYTAPRAMACVCQWARRQRLFPGRRGTGRYTFAQIKLYDEIVQHLQTLRPVCLGTHELVGTPDPVRGTSGEKKSKGLAGKHAYAVTDYHRDNATGARFVQVFNPWGLIGRGYTFSPSALHLKPSRAACERLMKGEKGEKAYETDEPLFWLELADVTKRCNEITYCKTTPEVIKAGRQLSARK